MVPVAPRTRTPHDEALLEVMHVQNRLSKVNSQIPEEEPKEPALGRVPGNADTAAPFSGTGRPFSSPQEALIRLKNLLLSRRLAFHY